MGRNPNVRVLIGGNAIEKMAVGPLQPLESELRSGSFEPATTPPLASASFPDSFVRSAEFASSYRLREGTVMRMTLHLAVLAMGIGLGLQSTIAAAGWQRFRAGGCCGQSLPVYIAAPSPSCCGGSGWGYSGFQPGFSNGMSIGGFGGSYSSPAYPIGYGSMGMGGYSSMGYAQGSPVGGFSPGYGIGSNYGYGAGMGQPVGTMAGYPQASGFGGTAYGSGFSPTMSGYPQGFGIGSQGIGIGGQGFGFGAGGPNPMGYPPGSGFGGSGFGYGPPQASNFGGGGYGYGFGMGSMMPTNYAPLPAHYPPPASDLVW